jgi:hypothetical protein
VEKLLDKGDILLEEVVVKLLDKGAVCNSDESGDKEELEGLFACLHEK